MVSAIFSAVWNYFSQRSMEQYRRELDKKEAADKDRRKSESVLLPRGLAILRDLHNNISIMQEASFKQKNIGNADKEGSPYEIGDIIFSFHSLTAELDDFLMDSKIYTDDETQSQLKSCYDQMSFLGFHSMLMLALNSGGYERVAAEKEAIHDLDAVWAKNLPTLKKEVESAMEVFEGFLNSKQLPYSETKIKRKELKIMNDGSGMALVDKE